MRTAKLFTVSDDLAKFTNYARYPFHLFLRRLVTSSFVNAFEKFLNYTVSPSLFGHSREEILWFLDRIAYIANTKMHPRIAWHIHMRPNHIEQFNVVSSIFRNTVSKIHHQFSFPPLVPTMVLNVAYESLAEQAVFKKSND